MENSHAPHPTPLENFAAPEPDGSRGGLWSTTTARHGGELTVGGVGVRTLASTYGTPLFVIDEEDMRRRAQAWKQAMEEAFAPLSGAQVYYAGKAFLSAGVATWMSEEGLCLDTCSLGELVTALAAGVEGNKIGLHGNNKSCEEIRLALRNDLAHIVVDSLAELALVETLAKEEQRQANIVLRVTTGVHAGGHEYISTAHEDQKFGLSLASGMAMRAAEEVLASPHLHLVGLHSHIGSQILNLDAFTQAAGVVMDLRAQIATHLGYVVEEVDLGGGYAVRYTVLDDIPPAPIEYARALASAVQSHGKVSGLPAPRISIEPGRSIAAPSTLTLYTVGTIKAVPLEEGSRRYVAVDGGMSDNIRPALYQADYTVTLANREPSHDVVRSRIVGKHCESGDIVVRDVALSANLGPGDLLAVPVTGAYGASMASNYNMAARPAVVAVNGGKSRLLIRRESVEDLLSRDVDAEGYELNS